MATTNPDNIWTPDSGDDYALTTDLAATADTIQDALTRRANYYVGDSTDMAAQEANAPEGAVFYNTDDDTEYRLESGSWVAVQFPVPDLPASKITSGTLSPERLPMVQGRTVCPAGGTQAGNLYYSGVVSITFPAGVFSSPPRVRVSSSGTGVHFACVQGTPTTGGFNVALTRLNAAPDGGQYIEWEAWQA